jgi:isoleucyl-tRNA synthetase
MSAYKNTLNLPRTDFPMRGNLSQCEPKIVATWRKTKLYQQIKESKKNKSKYVLHDGPPYANGRIHMGHAVNKVLKDIIIKTKLLDDYCACYIPGWDCHGLPIEINVEKNLGKIGDNLTPEAFRKACADYAHHYVEQQREAFERLGILGDWQHPYLTLDPGFEANTIRALGKLIEKGFVYRGLKPVHWCIACGSALADAEVEYQDKVSTTLDVRFCVTEPQLVWQRFNLTQRPGIISIPIWTTTAWTLPANEAVTLHPTFEYALVQIDNEYLIIAVDLLTSCLQRYQIKNYQIVSRIKGEKLEGLLLQHPFYDRQVPIILGLHVTTDTGTGAVHTAPAHGQEDYLIGMQYNLPIKSLVDDAGYFTEETKLFGRQSVFNVTQAIINELEKRHRLLQTSNITHSYPHCWRHKTPLIFHATEQYFINVQHQNLCEEALAAVQEIKWIPQGGQTRMQMTLKDRPDWCISRQRSWGVPIPLFIHRKSGQWHPRTLEFLAIIAQRVEQTGIQAWYALDPKELLGDDASNYRRSTDVLDVWFESGITHYAVLQQRSELNYPADLYLEGSDQHRGWFQSSLLSAIALNQSAPYRSVLTHGFTVDEQGRKMSKSVGNVIEPDTIVNQLGADVLRLWVASTDYRGEMTISEQILQRTAEAYRRIRNTMRFLLANLHDFNPDQDQVDCESLLSLDRCMLQRADLIQKNVIEAYRDYQFHLIYQTIHNFCINDLGGFYLDIIKDRQYTLQKTSVARRSAQTALYHITEAMVRWLAPILSFTAEEIWAFLPGQRSESIFLTQWYEIPYRFNHDPLNKFYAQQSGCQQYWEAISQIRDAVNKEIEKYRQSGSIGSALEASVLLFVQPQSLLAPLLGALQDELRFVLITSDAKVHTTTSSEGTVYHLLGEELRIHIVSLGHKIKCVRCWHRTDDIGQDQTHPELCQRCITNLPGGLGEHRCYA